MLGFVGFQTVVLLLDLLKYNEVHNYSKFPFENMKCNKKHNTKYKFESQFS